MWATVAGQQGALNKYLGDQAGSVTGVSTSTKIITILYASSLTLITLSCIFGFIGTIRRKYSMIASYASFAKVFFVVITSLALVNVIMLWVNKDNSRQSCEQALKNLNDTKYDCNSNTYLIIATVIAFIPSLFQLYAAIVIHQYRNVLAKEQNRQLPDAHYAKVSGSDTVEHRPYHYPFATADTGYSGNHA
jgi:hypothetical protein